MGEDLRVEGEVSPRLREGGEAASRIYAEWWGYRPIAIDAAVAAVGREPGPATGLFFSNGIDSLATLLRSLNGTMPDRITHLVSLPDLNPHYSRRTERAVWEGLETAAADFGLPLLRVRTNAADVVRARMGWTRAFGAVLAGCALAIGPLLRTQLFACTVDETQDRPRGSHPELDLHWGTERTSFRHDATETTRTERILMVGGDSRALRHLKLCWIADTPGNCGRCFKCLRAMTTLALDGAGGWEHAFETPLSPESILAQDIKLAQVVRVERELLPLLESGPSELRAAWGQKVREVRRFGPRRRWPQRIRRGVRRKWRRTRRRVRARLGSGT